MKFNLFSYKNWKLSLGNYKFGDYDVSNIIRELDKNGWEIGLHGSYNSYINKDLLIAEKKRLENVLKKKIIGVRQHYLNLDIPRTWSMQKEVGFLYDSSLGKKNDIGFIDKKYKPFIDHNSGILVIPLTLMDGYLFASSISHEEAWKKCLNLINEAESENAVLVILWHQRVFNENEFPGYARLYKMFINECKKRKSEFLLCKDLF